MELKFRAWDERNNEMVYSESDDCFHIDGKGVYMQYAIPKSESGLETVFFTSRDVDMFTGLTDKYGEEIYENSHVRLAGYGIYECAFPFTELYEAACENDILELIGR